MSIRSKVQVEQFIQSFKNWSEYDAVRLKHYFVFDDKKRGGKLTLMKKEDRWSIHGVGETYCDLDEITLQVDEVRKLVWNHRAAINRSIKARHGNKQLFVS